MAINTNKKRLLGRAAAIDNNTMGVYVKNVTQISQIFLYNYFLSNVLLKNIASSSNPPSINATNLSNLQIPLPPMDIQKSIVAECEKVDSDFENAKKQIENGKMKIEEIMGNVKGEMKKISEVCKYNSYSINPSETPKKEFIYVDIESVKNGVGEILFEKKILGNNAPSRARRLAKSKSTIVSTVRPNLKGFAYLENEVENTVYSTGFAIFESADENKLLSKMIYYNFMYSKNLMNQMLEAMPKGQYPSINRNDIDNFTIPVPSLDQQKEIVSQIEAIEKEIEDAKKTMEECGERKSAILKKWLE